MVANNKKKVKSKGNGNGAVKLVDNGHKKVDKKKKNKENKGGKVAPVEDKDVIEEAPEVDEVDALEQASEDEQVNEPKPKKAKQDKEDKPAVQQESDEKESDEQKLIVRLLPKTTTEETLKALVPDVVKIRLRKNIKEKKDDRRKQQNNCFAYLVFKDEAAAENGYKKLQNANIDGSKIAVDYVGSKSSFKREDNHKRVDKNRKRDPKRLNISGIGKNANVADVKKLLKDYIDFFMPMKRETNSNLGFAFVEYKSEDDAKKALNELKSKTLFGKTLSVDFAFERPEKTRDFKKFSK